jgi:hypothetical protein
MVSSSTDDPRSLFFPQRMPVKRGKLHTQASKAAHARTARSTRGSAIVQSASTTIPPLIVGGDAVEWIVSLQGVQTRIDYFVLYSPPLVSNPSPPPLPFAVCCLPSLPSVAPLSSVPRRTVPPSAAPLFPSFAAPMIPRLSPPHFPGCRYFQGVFGGAIQRTQARLSSQGESDGGAADGVARPAEAAAPEAAGPAPSRELAGYGGEEDYF